MTSHFNAKRFFMDKNGHIIIAQRPNLPICGWLVFVILSALVSSKQLQTGFSQLGTAFLFLWAYLEITNGVNYFRRLLGLVVMAWVVIGFFR